MEKEIRALPTPAGVITVTDRKNPIPFGIEEIKLSDEAAGILKSTGRCLYIVIDTDRLQNGKVYSFSWGGNRFEFYDSDEFESTYFCESSGWVLEFSMPDIDDIALHHRDGFDAGYEFVDYPNSKPNGFSFALTENRRRFIKFPIGWAAAGADDVLFDILDRAADGSFY